MTENNSDRTKRECSAVVDSNKQIGKHFYRIGLQFNDETAEAFSLTRPGQFAQLDLSTISLPAHTLISENLADSSKRNIILRRPFSFCNVTVKDKSTYVEILYCVVGPASIRMTALSPQDEVNVIGPLGNGFWIPENKKQAILLAGGMGSPPLEHLAQFLTAEHSDILVQVFVGAKTVNDLPFEKKSDQIAEGLGFTLKEFTRYGIESKIATDDGSAGFAGAVTDYFQKWLSENHLKKDETIIYSCGPEAMLASVADIAQKENIDCQVSVERRMACGIGICQSCAVECKTEGTADTVYKLCCKDGPVFDSSQVVFIS
ncbi:MAG: dihydroorotate dehydrogenase electron transfer subunit [Planctomycetota bacterium]|jgi:dihydroorotate dehydrogenase electron transfer subunit